MSLFKFAEKLNELIEYENLSIRSLAKQINVDRKSLRLWIEGKFYPRYDALIRLSRFFDIGIDDLLSGEIEIYENRFKGVTQASVEIDDVANYFSVKLRAKKEERKLTVYAISKMLNLDAKSVSKWFIGTSVPETVNLIKLSKMFQISVSELLGQ